MLTRRQFQFLQFVQRYQREHGYPPTRREIGAALAIRSQNGVFCHLHALARKGFVHVDLSTARGLRVSRHVAGLPLMEARGGKLVEVGLVVLDAAGQLVGEFPAPGEGAGRN